MSPPGGMLRHHKGTDSLVQAYLDRRLNASEACAQLGVNRSTLCRWAQRRREGASLEAPHGLRGRRSNHRKPETLRAWACARYALAYAPHGAGVAEFMEREHARLHGAASYEAVRGWLARAGLLSASRGRRTRRRLPGEVLHVVELSGWLLAMDEATREVCALAATAAPDLGAYVGLLARVFGERGLPLAVRAHPSAGVDRRPLSRMLNALGVEWRRAPLRRASLVSAAVDAFRVGMLTGDPGVERWNLYAREIFAAAATGIWVALSPEDLHRVLGAAAEPPPPPQR